MYGLRHVLAIVVGALCVPIVKPTNVTRAVGENATIECHTNRDVSWKYKQHIDDDESNSKTFSFQGHPGHDCGNRCTLQVIDGAPKVNILSILNISIDDTGVYICTAGSDTAGRKFGYLQVQGSVCSCKLIVSHKSLGNILNLTLAVQYGPRLGPRCALGKVMHYKHKLFSSTGLLCSSSAIPNMYGFRPILVYFILFLFGFTLFRTGWTATPIW